MAHIATLLPYIQVILAVILISLVLLQQSDDDLGGVFGGTDTMNAPTHTRRGLEKILYNLTIIVVVLFVVSAILGLIIK